MSDFALQWRPPAGGTAGRWLVRVVEEGKRREITVPKAVAGTANERAAACRWAEAWMRQRAAPKAPEEPTLEELARRFLAIAKGAPATLAEYASHLRLSVLPRFGTRTAHELTLPELRQWMRELAAAGLGRQTCLNRASTLAVLLDCARGEGWTTAPNLVRDPAVRAQLPAQKRRRIEVLSVEALRALVACVDVPIERRLRALLGAQGLEDGVIAGLRWRDVHLEAGDEWVEVRTAIATRGPNGWATEKAPKNEYRRRVLPIGDHVAEALAWWKAEGWELFVGALPEAEDFVLPNADGRPSRPKSAKLLRQDLKRAGQHVPEGFTFHGLRAYFATQLAELGASGEERARLLGHRGATTAARYYTAAVIQGDKALVKRLPATPLKVHKLGSDAPFWSHLRDLNSRPTVYERAAAKINAENGITAERRTSENVGATNGTAGSNGRQPTIVLVHQRHEHQSEGADLAKLSLSLKLLNLLDNDDELWSEDKP